MELFIFISQTYPSVEQFGPIRLLLLISSWNLTNQIVCSDKVWNILGHTSLINKQAVWFSMWPWLIIKTFRERFSSIWQPCPGKVWPRWRLRLLRLEGAGVPGEDGWRGHRDDTGPNAQGGNSMEKKLAWVLAWKTACHSILILWHVLKTNFWTFS